MRERCEKKRIDGVRCGLATGHDGPHEVPWSEGAQGYPWANPLPTSGATTIAFGHTTGRSEP